MDVFQYEFYLYNQNANASFLESSESLVLCFAGSDTAIRYPGGVAENNGDVYWFLDTRRYASGSNKYTVWRICIDEMPMEQAKRYHAEEFYPYGRKEIPMRQCSILRFTFTGDRDFTTDELEKQLQAVPIFLSDDFTIQKGGDFTDPREVYIFQNVSAEFILAKHVYANVRPNLGESYASPEGLTKAKFKELLQNRIKYIQEEEIIGHLPDLRNGQESPELFYSLRGQYQYYILPDVPLPETVFVHCAPSASILEESLRETRVYLINESEDTVSVLRAFVHVCADGYYNINFAYHMRTYPIDDQESGDMLAFYGLRGEMQSGWVTFDHEYREDLRGTGDNPYPFPDGYVGSPEYRERYGDVDVRTGEPLE